MIFGFKKLSMIASRMLRPLKKNGSINILDLNEIRFQNGSEQLTSGY